MKLLNQSLVMIKAVLQAQSSCLNRSVPLIQILHRGTDMTQDYQKGARKIYELVPRSISKMKWMLTVSM